MRRPSPAILGSLALHAGVVALALVSWPRKDAITPIVSSVPVSIVSSTVIEAAAADNPSETLVEDDAATAPMEAAETPPPPEATPAPTPTPTPPRPTPTPSRAVPPRPTPPRPAPTPPRPAPRRTEPSLDLSTLQGPRRPTPNTGRPATGQQGAGRAPQATGPATASFNRVYQHWNPPCQTPGVNQMRIQMDVTLSPTGRITAGPTLVSPQSGGVWRAVADGAMQALVAAQPFDVPPGFEGGRYRPAFNAERACENR